MTLGHTPEAGLRRLQLCTVVFHLPTLQLPRITLPLLHALAACTIMSRYLQYLQRQCPKTGNPQACLGVCMPTLPSLSQVFLVPRLLDATANNSIRALLHQPDQQANMAPPTIS